MFSTTVKKMMEPLIQQMGALSISSSNQTVPPKTENNTQIVRTKHTNNSNNSTITTQNTVSLSNNEAQWLTGC
jgi:hypothetical protein